MRKKCTYPKRIGHAEIPFIGVLVRAALRPVIGRKVPATHSSSCSCHVALPPLMALLF